MAAAVVAAWLAAGPAAAQQALQPGAGVETGRAGWQVFSASAYSGYTYMAEPGTLSNVPGLPLGSDNQYGAALTVGWERFRKRSGFSLIYSPSYYGLVRNSGWDALNHSLLLRATRTFGSRWDGAFSVTGGVRSLSGFLFAPTGASNAVAAPGSAASLADAVLAGKYSNQQLAAALGSAPGLESPLTAELYSQRTLSGSLSASLAYRSSPRFSVHFSATGSRTQALNSGQPAGAASVALVPRMTMGSFGGGLSYAIGPRTNFSVDATESRTQSSYMDAYVTQATASLGRRFGMRWFLQGGGGAAVVRPLRTTVQANQGAQPVAHASIGYRLSSQSFMATVDRLPANSYGLGTGYTLSSGGAWQWHRPGSGWDLSASFREQIIRGSSQNLNGWMGGGALFKALSRRTGLQLSYSYMDNTGTYVAGARNIKVHALQAAVVWQGTPRAGSSSGAR
jgi:hypothetical protein